MAKSARASITKRNNRNLRATVFGPAHDARTARLSAKLQELVSKPRPEQEKKMDLDESSPVDSKEELKEGSNEEMDIDTQGVNVKPVKLRSAKKRSGKVHKVSKRKSKNLVVFPSERARKERIARSKGKR